MTIFKAISANIGKDVVFGGAETEIPFGKRLPSPQNLLSHAPILQHRTGYSIGGTVGVELFSCERVSSHIVSLRGLGASDACAALSCVFLFVF